MLKNTLLLALFAVMSNVAEAVPPSYTMRVIVPGLGSATTAPQSPRTGIALNGGVRTYGDGRIARSCLAYLSGSGAYSYTGDTGTGLYKINVGSTPLTVFCDMDTDTGGWTLVARMVRGSNAHGNTAAVGSLTSPTQNTAAKLSDTAINAIVTSNFRMRADDVSNGEYFQLAGTPFAAVGVAASRPMSPTFTGAYTGSPVDGAHGGLNAYPTKTLVYGGSAVGDTCRVGMAASSSDWCGQGSNGTVWVR